jgi:class 3 adenylate cyclase
MEPRIQYAKASDGVSIAYAVLGDGVPLVHLPWLPYGHLQMEWQVPEIRGWYERLAEQRMLVRLDGRGTGLSERDVTDFSLDARMLDMEAVVDRLNLEKFVLYGTLHSGPAAIAYAVRHPQRVSQLILWCTYALGSDWYESPRVRAVLALRDTDWQTFTEAAVRAFGGVGWEAGEVGHRLAVLLQESITQQEYQRFQPILNAVDVTELLPQVKAPTLVLHRRQWPGLGVDVARGLTGRIPDARLALLEGDSILAYIGDMEAAAMAIDEFLRKGQQSEPPEPHLPSGMSAILFADIADSTALTERLGDAAFRTKARELDGALRAAIRERGGTAVEGKLLGDGVLAVFTSAREAIEAALACGSAGDEAGLPLHLGIHAGDVIREKDPDGRDNVYGGAVNIASRIAGLSAAGEVLVSETVRSLARTSAGVGFDDRGEQELKGVGEAVRVWAMVEAAQ